jgi:flagellar biogenesis protein FliO
MALVIGAVGRACAADVDPTAGPPAVDHGAQTAAAPASTSAPPWASQPFGSNQPLSASNPPAPLEYPAHAVSVTGEIDASGDSTATRPPGHQPPLLLAPPAENARADARPGKMSPLVTGSASLGIVLGLFLLVVWVARRGGPAGATMLPHDAVEVLGRAPFAARQHVYLVHCGNKILLVHVSPAGAQTLTEIADPAEVERLLTVCQGPQPAGSPLRQFFGQFGQPPRDRRYVARQESAELDFAHLEPTHRGA